MAASSSNSTQTLTTQEMGDAQKVCGHQCEFLAETSEEYHCKRCQCVARELSIAVCCGLHYCLECLSPYHQAGQPCPGCGQEQFGIMPHVRYQRSILALEVRCSMKERGCRWTGKLQDLEDHLDVDKAGCEYVDVECPNKCDKPVPRYAIPHHLERSCPKRDYNCGYCGFTGSYEVVCNDHYPECDSYPIPCPNSCTVVSIEQGTLRTHLRMCPYQEIECEVFGCGEKFQRENLERHMDENASQHVGMMSVALREMSADFATKLREQESESRTRERETADIIREIRREKDTEIAALKKQLEELKITVDSKVSKIKENCSQQMSVIGTHLQVVCGRAPYHFTVSDYTQKVQNDHMWCSPPMYICKNGPKLFLSLQPYGAIGTNARSTHVSLKLGVIEGEYDDNVKWPIRCSITVQLLNQHRNQDHYTVNRGFQWSRPMHRHGIGFFGNEDEHRFISHKDLEWNSHKHTQFLKNDSLLLVVQRIEPHSDIFGDSSTIYT